MYIPLYVKTENSLLQSMIRIPELIAYAKEHHLKALGLADSNLYGAYEFYKACKQADIKPIIGLEIVLNGDKILLYCENEKGYFQLIQLATIQSERPIEISDLSSHSEGLLCIVPVISKNQYQNCSKLFQDIWIGYQTKKEKQLLKGKNIIYLQETLCLEMLDIEYLPYLYAIKDGKLLEEVSISKECYLKLENELDKDFLDGYQTIYNLCDLTIHKQDDLLPIYDCPNGLDSYQYMKQLCMEGMRRRFGNAVSRVYIERLKYELDIIQKMGFCNYFLVVWDYVKYAKEHNILVGPGRGSAAGSLVSYVLGITDVDPIEYQLLFERFLNPERITMPDIDIDFAYDKREEVTAYCRQKYGEKRVAGIITFGTLGAKQIVRDVGRVMELSNQQVDRICKTIDSRKTLKENYEENERLRNWFQETKETQKLLHIASKLEGLKRHTSIHAAGIIMCNRDLDEVIPLEKHESFYLTGYSMEYLEELGLLKMDFLALKTLTSIQNILDEINASGLNITFDSIPLEDPKALSIFTTVNTTGIFQFESAGMMNFLRKFKPTTFEDIFAALALYRPGPMNNIDHYIKRKQGIEPIDYFHQDLVSILKPTYGILIYQEQIMQVASILAGYSYGEADVLRRAMSKKKESILKEEKSKFIQNAIERGYEEKMSQTVYDLILKFASYGFNRSHSVAYAIIAYKMAYLKAYYPKIFMKSLLTSVIGSSIDTKEYIEECKLNHIAVLTPDINKSGKEYLVEKEGIRYPLTNIKNLGITVVESILDARKTGPFLDIYDFIKRTNRKTVNKKVIQCLIDAGCFDTFHLNKRTLQENLDLILNYGELIKDLDEEYALKPELEQYEEYSKKELMQKELDTFGLYLSNHPVTEYRIQKDNSISLQEISKYFDQNISLIVVVDSWKQIDTKKGDKMCFITGSDEIGTIEIVLFPSVYQNYENIPQGGVILVTGRVEKRFDQYQLIANKIEILES